MKRLIAVLMLLLGTAGCGSAPAAAAAEVPAIADAAAGLAEACSLQDHPSDLKPAEIAQLLNIDDTLVQDAVYYADGADAVAVVQTADPKAVQRAVSAYADTLASQSALYTPAEVGKIQKRIIDTEGPYVIFVIADDYDAVKMEIAQLFR